MSEICIFTIKDDLHALIVQKELEKRNVISYVVEINNLAFNDSINIDFYNENYFILDRVGRKVNIERLSLIWWRRSRKKQNYKDNKIAEAHEDLINNDIESAVAGLLESRFKGVWISHPYFTTLASNKIYQTNIALKVGLNVPKTLFSQDPVEVRNFINANKFDIIIKPVYGTSKETLITKKIEKSMTIPEANIKCCPTIYQECIPGNIHYRINVFGEDVFAFKLDSEDLDWRQNLQVPIELVYMDKKFELLLMNYLKKLKIKMGIFDFKLSSFDNKLYFFEVNPQGQFLFLEGLTKFNLTAKFTDYLIRSMKCILHQSTTI